MKFVRMMILSGFLLAGFASIANTPDDNPADRATKDAVADKDTDATAQGLCPQCLVKKVPPGNFARPSRKEQEETMAMVGAPNTRRKDPSSSGDSDAKK